MKIKYSERDDHMKIKCANDDLVPAHTAIACLARVGGFVLTSRIALTKHSPVLYVARRFFEACPICREPRRGVYRKSHRQEGVDHGCRKRRSTDGLVTRCMPKPAFFCASHSAGSVDGRVLLYAL